MKYRSLLFALALAACGGKDEDSGIVYPDEDGDGYTSDVDCQDDNPDVNPGVDELCDGTDWNCDGLPQFNAVDGFTFYLDGDGDGYGDPDTSESSCTQRSGYTDNSDDCNDRDPNVNPGMVEVCDEDDRDEDCNGEDAPYGMTDLSSGDLLITEVMPDPNNTTDATGEWIEIYNNSGGEVDLDGLHIRDDSSGTTLSGETRFDDGEYVVLARSSSGDVTPDATYGTNFSLNNDADSVTLYESSSQDTTYDSVDYDGFDITTGYSLSLSPDHTDVDQNDFRGHWCDGTTEITSGGDVGTPGDENDSCNFTYTHDDDIQSIWNSACTGCHGSSGGLGMSSNTWETIVDGTANTGNTLVDPGSPDDSYLYAKLKGVSGTNFSVTANMPKNNSTLSSSNLDKIETWIEEGAPQ